MTARLAPALLIAGALLSAPANASAFGGFYAGKSPATRSSSRTDVVLFREGTRTVISLQRDYLGPAEDLALVFSVPASVDPSSFTLQSPALLSRIDRQSAPRLVETKEQDPCPTTHQSRRWPVTYELSPYTPVLPPPAATGSTSPDPATASPPPPVATSDNVEFELLRGEQARASISWLREKGYVLPKGAEATLQSQAEAGASIAIVRVRADALSIVDGRAVLPPVRFHFDDETFQLPAGLIAPDSVSRDDLVVHVIAQGQRYEVEGRPAQFVPTNVEVNEQARERFGAFYSALFDRTVREQPGTVVTEYAWSVASCEGCTGPEFGAATILDIGLSTIRADPPRTEKNLSVWPYTLTRLHARSDPSVTASPWTLVKVPPVMGGWGNASPDLVNAQSALVTNQSGSINAFQARYSLRVPFDGAITCFNPTFELWAQPQLLSTTSSLSAPREQDLSQMLAADLPRFGLRADPRPVIERRTNTAAAIGTWLRSAKGSVTTGFLMGLGLVAVLQRKMRKNKEVS